MSPSFAEWNERTLDLAVARGTEGLSSSEEAELRGLAEPGDLDEFERSIAAIHLASLCSLEAPPPEVIGRLHRSAHAANSSRWGGFSLPLSVAGWLLAAAALVVIMVGGETPGGPLDPGEGRSRLLASGAPSAQWAAGQDQVSAGVQGGVVWSTEAQEGYMRFEGLAPNDPSKAQYQLWIFDSTRPDGQEHPIDGGVFDIPDRGEHLVAIDPKLRVGSPALFAVTVEVPGGVVISSRERLVVSAAYPEG